MVAARQSDQVNRYRGASQSAERGLDWLNLFVANIQTGFGPFIAVYLTTRGWTQTSIGIALSLGTATAMASQIPAGALVDAARSKSGVAAISILAFTASALLFAMRPTPFFVYVAEILHGFSSCTLGPAVAAMSLALAGRAAFGVRLGRNARYASIGNGVGAALLGACGFYLSTQAVFLLTAILTIPALVTLRPLSRLNGVTISRDAATPITRVAFVRALANRRFLILAGCAMLFTLANAAMLPLASVALTKKAANEASLLIAACIVLPQLIVALVSPSIGRLAQARGRRGVLLLGFCMLPLRGLLFASVNDPMLVVLVQALDGVAAASFGVCVPLIISDVTGGTGHFNLSLGFVGFAIGIGATIGTTLAGWVGTRFGDPVAFVSLAAIGLVAALSVWAVLPETRPAGA